MAMQKKLIVLAILAMFMELTMAATTYTVGSPSGGWDLSTDLKAWATGQSFLVGDSLLFTYTSNHNVLEVSKDDFDVCGTSSPIFSDASGSTTISLTSAGKRYFVCGTPGHCSQGQKVEINTLVVESTAPPPPVESEPPPPVASEPPPPLASEPPPSPPTSPVTPPPTTAPPTTPPPVTTIPSPKSPASSPPPTANTPGTPKSSAHKRSFQGTLAWAVSFLTVFLAL